MKSFEYKIYDDVFINAFCNIFGKEKALNSKIVGIEFKLEDIK